MTDEAVAALLRRHAETQLAGLDREAEAPAPHRSPRRRFPKPAIEFFVSSRGSDRNPGSRQKPFASLEKARDAVRGIRKRRSLPAGGVSVTIMAGEYPLRETFVLTKEDSGTADSPIVYRASRKGSARFNGGTRLTGFVPVSDPGVLARLPEVARGKVLQCDLKANGVTNCGTLQPRGFARGGNPAVELFFDGHPLQPARYPNEGFLLTGDIVEEPTDDSGGGFRTDCDRLSRWAGAPDAWLWGTWFHDWADSTTAIERIDVDARTIKAKHPTMYGMREGHRFYVFNLLEEIDEPGEWYLDRSTGMLYVYPPSDPETSRVELSVHEGPMVQMTDVSHVVLRGLTFETSRLNGIEMSGGEGCLIAACTLRRLGGTGVIVQGGRSHGVLGCDIAAMGRGGVIIEGGERRTLTPGGHFVENCHIHDFSRIDRTYTPAVRILGCGNRIAHCLFNDSPHHAIRLEGNDHVIEYNEVHSVVYEMDDQAGLDIFYNPTYRGNVARYNYWHHIGSGLDTAGQAGIRLDDAISGVMIYGNVFERCSGGQFGGVQIHGGKENLVANNVFAHCKHAVSFSRWGADRWKEFLASDRVQGFLKDAGDPTAPPLSDRYPTLVHVSENPDINYVWRNVVYRCGNLLERDRGQTDECDNVVTGLNPGFADPESGDYTPAASDAILREVGFRPIPFSEIGLYENPMRASWPVHHTVTPHYHEE